MNLIDVLERKTIVENDEDDEMEENGARQGEIIRKFMKGLHTLLEAVEDENVIGDVLFSTLSNPEESHDDAIKVLTAILGAYGVDTNRLDTEKLVALFKKMGLSRGDALFVVDQND